MRTVLVALALAASGCVNDYLVGEGSGSTSTGMPGSSSDTGVDTSGASSCGTDGCGDSTKADGDGTSHGDTAADTSGFACMACASDAECGDDFDNCVGLDMLGPLCLFACPEAGCPSESTCRMVLSVDGAAAMQCAPMAGVCDPIGTDDGGDGTGTGTGTGTTGAMTGDSASGSAGG